MAGRTGLAAEANFVESQLGMASSPCKCKPQGLRTSSVFPQPPKLTTTAQRPNIHLPIQYAIDFTLSSKSADLEFGPLEHLSSANKKLIEFVRKVANYMNRNFHRIFGRTNLEEEHLLNMKATNND